MRVYGTFRIMSILYAYGDRLPRRHVIDRRAEMADGQGRIAMRRRDKGRQVKSSRPAMFAQPLTEITVDADQDVITRFADPHYVHPCSGEQVVPPSYATLLQRIPEPA